MVTVYDPEHSSSTWKKPLVKQEQNSLLPRAQSPMECKAIGQAGKNEARPIDNIHPKVLGIETRGRREALSDTQHGRWPSTIFLDVREETPFHLADKLTKSDGSGDIAIERMVDERR